MGGAGASAAGSVVQTLVEDCSFTCGKMAACIIEINFIKGIFDD